MQRRNRNPTEHLHPYCYTHTFIVGWNSRFCWLIPHYHWLICCCLPASKYTTRDAHLLMDISSEMMWIHSGKKLMDLSYLCRRRNQVRCHAAIKIVDSTSNIPYVVLLLFITWCTSRYLSLLSRITRLDVVRFTRRSYQYGYNLKLQRVVDQPSFTYTWICILKSSYQVKPPPLQLIWIHGSSVQRWTLPFLSVKIPFLFEQCW